MSVVVTIRHPRVALIEPFTTTIDAVLRGDWAIAARLCAKKASDLAGQQAALTRKTRESGLTFAPSAHTTFDMVILEQDALTVEADTVGHVAGALDLYMRILCGQWSEMDYHCALRSGTGRAPGYEPYSLLTIRCAYGNARSSMLAPTTPGGKATYKPLGHDEWPDHPHASVGIAEAVLPARIAYWAYKLLGGGAPGGPTFSLPDGPLSVEVDGQTINRIRRA
jgi:hypothetical protein